MDYITINMNKKFLIIMLSLIGIYIGGKYLYHRGYVAGGTDVFEYLMQAQQGKTDTEKSY